MDTEPQEYAFIQVISNSSMGQGDVTWSIGSDVILTECHDDPSGRDEVKHIASYSISNGFAFRVDARGHILGFNNR
jgi:hypothetical protein